MKRSRVSTLLAPPVIASAFAALSALAAPPALAAETHPYTVRDQQDMRRLSDPQVSPDGTRVAFALRTTDLDANRGRFDIWVVNVDGTGLRQLTTEPENDVNPRWAPDGKSLYFISSRAGTDQVFRLALDGGEATKVTDLPLDVANLSVSPDGLSLAFSLEVFPDCDSIDCTVKRLDEKKKQKGSGKLYDNLFIRHWDTWADGRRNHLFVMPVKGGKPIDVTAGMDADAPSKPFGGTEEYAFAPDSKTLVFTARDVGREEAWSTNLDLFRVPADGSAKPTNLTASNPATDTQPVFSPDGKKLAYLAMSRPGYEADRLRIMLRDAATGAERELAPKWDRSGGGLTWSSDGKTIYTATDDIGNKKLFALDVATGRATALTALGNVAAGPLLAAGGQLVYALDHLRSPDELYAISAAGGAPRQITSINQDKLATVRFGEPEQMSFKGWNNETVYAWIVKPVDFDPAKKYPVAFLIHGGPQGSFGNDFHYRWNPQVYAGAGFAAIMVDFHGSTGYGQAFTDAIRDDWGGKPLEDLKKGLAAALAKYPWMDGTRAAALGASYGGYMINWIQGNWPDGFKCLVSHDGNLDEHMAYYDTEELWFPEWEHMGTPWDNPQGYDKHSPLRFVKNWKTPMLVVHGGRDYRVVETQGIAVFTALQRRGIPSKFLHFADENHWVLKPHNSIQWHDTVLDWLRQWTK